MHSKFKVNDSIDKKGIFFPLPHNMSEIVHWVTPNVTHVAITLPYGLSAPHVVYMSQQQNIISQSKGNRDGQVFSWSRWRITRPSVRPSLSFNSADWHFNPRARFHFFRATHCEFRLQNSRPNSFYFKIFRAFRIQCVTTILSLWRNTCRWRSCSSYIFFFIFHFLIWFSLWILLWQSTALLSHVCMSIRERPIKKTFYF